VYGRRSARHVGYPDAGPPRRRRIRIIAASALGLALLASGIAFATTSLAGTWGNRNHHYRWYEEASRIPNDQGPSPECSGTKAPTSGPAPSRTTAAPATAAPTTAAPTTAAPTTASSTGTGTSTSTSTGAPEATESTVEQPAAAAGAAADSPAVSAQHRHGGGNGQPPASCHEDQGGPAASDFVDIQRVAPNARSPRPGRDASTGTFVSQCGRNENDHHNSDNFIVAPGVTNGAHHTHDYVGNVSADGNSTNESLAAAGTTCRFGDKSTYYWPVLRRLGTVEDDANAPGGGNDLNVGKILEPTSVVLSFRGNPTSKVVAMPRFIRIITGDAKATTNGPANAKAQWTCTGFGNRLTTQYPLCPRGSQVQRVLVMPSCWDGQNADSANHRTHIVFPDQTTGACPEGTKAVPQLRLTLTYNVPSGRSFALDSFPEQLHNPLTDHADFVSVMPDNLMAFAVQCINSGRNC
jgi:uncharacterized protein DUF1996